MNNVISFSGGKDSTAMALLMLEKGIPIHSVIAFDTGWEFPQMYDHWELFEQTTGLKIVKLRSNHSFDHWMFEREIVARKGPKKGEIHRIGNGWPSPLRRWCTSRKISAINKYMKKVSGSVSCIGIASDEPKRIKTTTEHTCRYPLIEWGVDEFEALAICKLHGFHWGGLYDVFSRVSCFCCPLKRIGDMKLLRTNFPHLWERMLEWDDTMTVSGSNRGFYKYETVRDLDNRFAKEEEKKWML